MRPPSPDLCLALLALASCSSIPALSQAGPPAQAPSPPAVTQPVSAPIPGTPQAYAATLRRYIVEQYATPELRAAFNQPAPQPLDFKHAMKTAKSMDEYQKLVYNSMAPPQIFTIAFARGLASAMKNIPLDGTSSASSTSSKPRRSALFAILSRLTEQVPVIGDYAGSAVNAAGTARARAAENALQSKVLASEGESHMRQAQLFIDLLLPPTEAEGYRNDSYPQKAAKLFEAAAISLRQLPFPNGMVLYICEVPGVHGSPATGQDVQENAGIFAPDDPRFKDATWSRLTEEQKWRIITDGTQHYFDDKEAALADPARSAAALDSIPATQNGTPEAKVLEAIGPEGLKAYQTAKGEDKSSISRAANAINAAYQFLVMLNLGAPAESAPKTAGSS